MTEKNRWQEKRDFIVDQWLSQDKKPFQRLGQGVHDGVFYYGTNIYNNDCPMNAVVTSDKKLYVTREWYEEGKKQVNCEIRNDFGLKYRVDFNDDALEYPWESKAIKAWIKGKTKTRPLKEIVEEIEKTNEEYIDHFDERSHKFIACDIFSTYGFTLFESKGRAYFRAEKGSGKSKQSRLYKNLAFNAFWVTKGTESSYFRDLEATCGTPIVDNLDKVNDELKNNLYHLIETGLYQDASYRLTGMSKRRTEKYRTYSPLVVNNILGLDENTVDKTFEIVMLKTDKKTIARKKIKAKHAIWARLRNEMRVWWLTNWKEIEEAKDKLEITDSDGRFFDVVQAPLTIASIIGGDFYKTVLEYSKEKYKETENVNIENNKNFLIFTAIKEDMGELTLKKIRPSQILKDILMPKLYPTLDKEKDEKGYRKAFLYQSKDIVKRITSVPMFRKKGISGGLTTIVIKKQDLDRYIKLQGYDRIEDEPEEEEEKPAVKPKKEENGHKQQATLHNPTNPPNPTNATNPTNTNNNKKKINKQTVELCRDSRVRGVEITPVKSVRQNSKTPTSTDWKPQTPEFEFEKCEICKGPAGSDGYCNDCRVKAKAVAEDA